MVAIVKDFSEEINIVMLKDLKNLLRNKLLNLLWLCQFMNMRVRDWKSPLSPPLLTRPPSCRFGFSFRYSFGLLWELNGSLLSSYNAFLLKIKFFRITDIEFNLCWVNSTLLFWWFFFVFRTRIRSLFFKTCSYVVKLHPTNWNNKLSWTGLFECKLS